MQLHWVDAGPFLLLLFASTNSVYISFFSALLSLQLFWCVIVYIVVELVWCLISFFHWPLHRYRTSLIHSIHSIISITINDNVNNRKFEIISFQFNVNSHLSPAFCDVLFFSSFISLSPSLSLALCLCVSVCVSMWRLNEKFAWCKQFKEKIQQKMPNKKQNNKNENNLSNQHQFCTFFLLFECIKWAVCVCVSECYIN